MAYQVGTEHTEGHGGRRSPLQWSVSSPCERKRTVGERIKVRVLSPLSLGRERGDGKKRKGSFDLPLRGGAQDDRGGYWPVADARGTDGSLACAQDDRRGGEAPSPRSALPSPRGRELGQYGRVSRHYPRIKSSQMVGR